MELIIRVECCLIISCLIGYYFMKIKNRICGFIMSYLYMYIITNNNQ